MLRTVPVDMSYHKPKYGSSRYREGYSDTHNKRIALPYVIYQITLSGLQLQSFYIAFRRPYDYGTVCCPFTAHAHKNIVDAVNHYIGFYWQCEYRYCLHHHIPDHPAFKSWADWEKASEDNPLFMLQVPWHKMGFTMADLLKDVANKVPTPPAFQDLSSKFIQAASDILTIPEGMYNAKS